jgi:hypothetical protein
VLPQIHQQVPRLPHRPRIVRMRCHAQDMHMAGAHLQYEEHIDAAQRDRAVNVEEVARQYRGGLRAQEPLPLE